MKNNVFIGLIGILMVTVVGETGYFIRSLDTNRKQIKSIEREVENKIQQRELLIKDIIIGSELSKELNVNEIFKKIISENSEDYFGNTLFIFLPGNVCLDCIREHFQIVTKIVGQKENLALIILCRPVDYRKNQLFAQSKPFVNVGIVGEAISINSDRPFVFYLNANGIDGLFFINKNFEDYTKASMFALSNNFK